ncbi:alpha/beta hydrolase fold-domain-containing protein [Lactifluus volemus]|nr:alpha/beta hydrolase fold-domain-containing protein [Lactifluus volemus]
MARPRLFLRLSLLFELLTLSFRLPYWFVRNVPRSFRGRPSWSLSKAVHVEFQRRRCIISTRFYHLAVVANHTMVDQGSNVKHVWLNPTPDLLNDKLRTWAAEANVDSMRIPGYWFDEEGVDTPIGAKPHPNEKIIYSLHGGAYIFCSASPHATHAPTVRDLLKYCKDVRRIFAVEYRLSSAAPEDTPANAFPAALLDALAGYTYLVQSVGFAPQDIIIEGDSAGGNLALALTRYLVENVGLAGLPAPPGGLLLLSPWADVTYNPRKPGSRAAANRTVDYVENPDLRNYARRAFLGPRDPLDPYISPGSDDPLMPHVSFDGFPRTLITAGGAEVLIDEIAVLVERMKKGIGEKVTYYEAPDEVHDYLCSHGRGRSAQLRYRKSPTGWQPREIRSYV